MTKHVVRMELDEADHYSEAQKRAIRDSYPDHERDAREKGIPVLGSGAVFPVPRNLLEVEPFEIPRHWFEIGGLDIGWDHPTAAVRLVWDRDTETKYVTHEYRRSKAIPLLHAEHLKNWGEKMAWAWPHDALAAEKGTGNSLKELYVKHGLNMLEIHAQLEDGGTGVEAGIFAMLEDMEAGKFKVFSTCRQWFEEQAVYHRKDGKIVKEFDDLMAATRYAYVMLRFSNYVYERRSRNRPRYADTSRDGI